MSNIKQQIVYKNFLKEIMIDSLTKAEIYRKQISHTKVFLLSVLDQSRLIPLFTIFPISFYVAYELGKWPIFQYSYGIFPIFATIITTFFIAFFLSERFLLTKETGYKTYETDEFGIYRALIDQVKKNKNYEEYVSRLYSIFEEAKFSYLREEGLKEACDTLQPKLKDFVEFYNHSNASALKKVRIKVSKEIDVKLSVEEELYEVNEIQQLEVDELSEKFDKFKS